jgi:hypothetical protein
MKLKHQWNDGQAKILTAAKRQLRRKRFFMAKESVVAVQTVLFRRGIPFYDAWSEMTDDMGGKSYFSREFWHTVFIQACSGVLTDTADFSDLVKNVPEYFNEKFKNLPALKNPERLPERLPDKELYAAAQNGDLPKIMMLYDMSFNPGQKMKNVYHLLLNQKSYDCALQLHERYGGLDKIQEEILKQHFFQPGEKKGNFNNFFCRIYKKEKDFLLRKSFDYGVLDQTLIPLLESGLSPEILLIDSSIDSVKIQVPLWKFMHFADEIAEQLKRHFPWSDLCYNSSDSRRFMRSLMTSAEKFSEWERKNLHD